MKLMSIQLGGNGRLSEGRETSGTSTSREKLVNFNANPDHLSFPPFPLYALIAVCSMNGGKAADVTKPC